MARQTRPRTGRAVVLGASMGGLLAARALSDHFDTVTLVERDALPRGPEHRKGVPQSKQSHGVLAGGMLGLEAYFPGLRAEVRASGAFSSDMGDSRWYIGGRRLALRETIGLPGAAVSRVELEHLVRQRVLALPQVRLRDDHDVLGLTHESGRVTGARVLGRRDGSAEETLAADLVVDATGRGSQLTKWLGELGYPEPPTDVVRVGLGYATALYKRRPTDLDGQVALVIGAAPPNRHCGVAVAIDEHTWMITVIGYLGERVEPNHEGFKAFTRAMPVQDLHELVSASEPLSEVTKFSFPYSQRRRYERVRLLPEGVIAFGDSMCSFNPAFGQGMTVATLEAQALGRCLSGAGLRQLPRRFYRATQPIIDVPWSTVVGNDLRFEEVEGKRPFGSGLLNRYLDRLLRVAEHDAVVAERFFRVANLIDAPPTVMAPAILRRVLWPSTPSATGPRLPSHAQHQTP